MANMTQVLGAEIVLPVSSGAATSFTQAPVVRLVNTDTNAHVVSVVATQGGTGIGSFTMPAGSVEYLRKRIYSMCFCI